jgi:S-formylglutathione hydrolase FrmB
MGSTSLMQGWLPSVVQVLTVLALIRAVGWRSRRWRLVILPLLVTAGFVTAIVAHLVFDDLGIASEPAPWQLWSWVGLSGFAVATVVAGWPGTRWSRRNVMIFAASLCLLSTGLTVNGWIGYFPTVATAWNQLAARPLPNETDWATVTAMRQAKTPPSKGAVVRVDFGAAASGFEHRPELVYVPPAWFASDPPPRLPAIMMIGGQFNTPADWLRVGDAVTTMDAFAATHGGQAPVAVFVDPSGSFANDTECVNGPRGNADDHLVRDVVPRMITEFGVRADMGVVGFSTGGTCALLLAVRHPGAFDVFVDIAGDLGPNAGTRGQTVDRLFGGDEQAWAAFDPASVITRHGRYANTSGVFIVPDRNDTGDAEALCALGRPNAIECFVTRLPGRHVWPFASDAFAATLPWLAGKLDTPGVPVPPVPPSGI